MITRKLLDDVEPTTDRLPEVVLSEQPPDRDPSEWDRDYLLDVAAASRDDSWRLSGHRQLLEAVCADYVQLDAQRRQDADRIAALEAKLAREKESHRVTTILQISGLSEGLRLTKQLVSLSEQYAVQGRAMAQVTAAYHLLRTSQLRAEASGRRPQLPRLIVDDAQVFDVTDTGTCSAAVADGNGAAR